jgi:hypothetical protein
MLWNVNECEKKTNKVMRVSRQPFPVKLMIDQKQLENVESIKYLGNIVTDGRRCAVKINIWVTY